MRIIAATDGEQESMGVVRVAAELARAASAEIELATVLEPLITAGSEHTVHLPHAEEVERARQQALEHRVRRQLEEAAVERVLPAATVLHGTAATALIDHAHARSADLILAGRRRKGQGAGYILGEVAGELSRTSDVPVLFVDPAAAGLPTRAVVVTDFGTASVRAAELAGSILGRNGHLTLAHVMPRLDFPAALVWGWEDAYARAAPGELERFRQELRLPPELHVELRIIEGGPVERVVELARELAADIVATGSLGYSYRQRIVMGGVPSSLLMLAPCSILVSPPPIRPPAHALPA